MTGADRRQAILMALTSIVPTCPFTGPSSSAGSGAPSVRSKALMPPERAAAVDALHRVRDREPGALSSRRPRDVRRPAHLPRSGSIAINRRSPEATTTPDSRPPSPRAPRRPGPPCSTRSSPSADRSCRSDHRGVRRRGDSAASNVSAAADVSRSSATGASSTILVHPAVRRRHHGHRAVACVRDREHRTVDVHGERSRPDLEPGRTRRCDRRVRDRRRRDPIAVTSHTR